MVAAWLGFFDSLIALAMVLAGLVGGHFGIAAPYFGFQLFLFGLLFGVLALITGLVGLLRTRRPQWRSAHGRAVVASYVGAILTAFLVYLRTGRQGISGDQRHYNRRRQSAGIRQSRVHSRKSRTQPDL